MLFNIARYYFTTLFREEGSRTFLNDLMKEPYIQHNTFTYALGSFNTEESEDTKFTITRGQFGKIRNEDMRIEYDKKNKEFISKNVHNQTEEIIEFFIHHDKKLLFIEKSSQIVPTTVQGIFKKIYNRNSSVKADLEIDYIFDDHDVYEAINQWHRVTKVKFKDLRPSNPSSKDTFEHIEKLLKETRSSKTTLQFEAEETSSLGENQLEVDSTLIREALALSSHGYGSAILTGEEGGEKKEVKTERYIRHVEIDFSREKEVERIKKIIEEETIFEHNEKDDNKQTN